MKLMLDVCNISVVLFSLVKISKWRPSSYWWQLSVDTTLRTYICSLTNSYLIKYYYARCYSLPNNKIIIMQIYLNILWESTDQDTKWGEVRKVHFLQKTATTCNSNQLVDQINVYDDHSVKIMMILVVITSSSSSTSIYFVFLHFCCIFLHTFFDCIVHIPIF